MTARRILPFAVLLVAATAGAQGPPATLNILPIDLPVGGGRFTLGQMIPVQHLSTQFPNDSTAWSVSSGTLPSGLVLDPAAGTITGTTTQAGAFTFTIMAIDGEVMQQGSRQYTVFVTTGAFLTLTQLAHPVTSVGNVYSTQAAQVSGGVPGYTWAFQNGTNGDGLTLDPNSGLLSGVPAAGGIFAIGVVVTDASGSTASSSFNLDVLGIATASLPNGTVGTAYSQTLTVAGGTGPFTWSLQSGTLPPGLNLSPQGQIAGTPTSAGTFSFQVLLTDSATGLGATKSFSITAIPATLTITTTSLPNGTVGTLYPTQTLTATSSGGALAWTPLSAPPLPQGLSLNAQGQISGTPTQSGTFSFQVQVSNSALSLIATQSLSITITAKLTITTTSPLPGGATGISYSQTLQGSGGTPPYNWTATGLPAGFSLDVNTGILSGTASTPSTSAISVTLTDAAQGKSTGQLTLVVSGPPTVTIGGLPATGFAATQPATTVSITGGTYPLAINGTMTLAFAPGAGDAKFATGSPTTATFTIAANASQGLFGTATSVPVMIGTVAGTITITTALQDSTGRALPPPAPTVITVNPTVPFITKVTPGPVTSSGFSISVTGRSTPRDMASAQFHFTLPTNNSTATADVTVSVSSAFVAWYTSSASNAFGSTFTMTVQFTFTGPPGATVPYTAVTVTMTNSVGTSTPSAPVSP